MKKHYLIICFLLTAFLSFAQAPFITTWEVVDGDLQIQISDSGNSSDVYNYLIDFGDGTVQDNVNGDINHTYSQAGIYTVSITGIFPRIKFSNAAFNSRLKIKSIEQWGDIQWTSMKYAFTGCSNLVVNANDSPDLSMVMDMAVMFRGASSLNQSLNNWDVSNVTNMEYMFDRASSFNQPLDNWDVSNVTDMSGMFYGANSFNQPLNTWDVSSVTDMHNLFYSANNFNQPLGNWDVSNVSDMSDMFEKAISFNQPLNSWTTSNVTTINQMFSGATMFNQSLDNWDISNVNILQQVFMGATSFNGALDNWDISNVQQLYEIFKGATSFNQPLGSWNVTNVFTMSELFSGASSFNQPLNNWDVSGVTNMALMFNEASSFNQSLENWNVSNVNTMNQMFNKATAFNQPLENWNVSNVTSMNRMFAEVFDFNQPLNNWDVSSVSSFDYMFYQTSFNQPLNNWNVSNAQVMRGTFGEATFFNQPLDNWDVSNVFGFNHMFNGAVSFNQDISNWDTSNASSMSYMFNNAYSFNQDISNWQFNSLNGTYSLYYFLNSCGLNIQNYDALLLQFYSLGYTGYQMQAGWLEYCDQGIVDILTNDFGWNIIGHSLSNECNTVFGSIYYDQNGNGCDAEDVIVNGVFINATDSNISYSKLINDSNYVLSVSNNSLTISLNNLPDYYAASPQTATVDFTTSSAEQVDFCLTANQAINDLNITLLPISEARPGFEAEYQLVIKNIGTQTVNNISVNFLFDDIKQSFVSAMPAETSSSSNSLDFTIASLSPFQSQEIDIIMQTFIPPTVNGDDILNFTASVSPDTNDYTPNDNSFTLEQIVVNSYDPNDKRVLQGNTITTDETSEYLDYIIRFQNTGSASAINVRIEDNLHPKLDWSTISITSASHDYNVQITNVNEVEFIFDNINLPSETQNEPASHGFIAYKIKPISTIQVGDIMSGDAGIFFDFNQPIITNTVSTEVISNLSVDEFSLKNLVSIYPNPTDQGVFINTKYGVTVNSVTLYNIQGTQLFKFDRNLEFINTNVIASGMYILSIVTNKGKVIEKLVIK